MTSDVASFRPTNPGPTALFLDTSGLFPYFHPDADQHEEVTEFVRRIGDGELPYRPLFTSTYVVDELVTLLQSRGRASWAEDALDMLLSSESITLLYETDEAFASAARRVREYDGDVSFTDHLCAVQMQRENVDHVFTYDGDYERLGLTVVPRGR